MLRTWTCERCSEPFKYRNDCEAHEKAQACKPELLEAPRWPRT